MSPFCFRFAFDEITNGWSDAFATDRRPQVTHNRRRYPLHQRLLFSVARRARPLAFAVKYIFLTQPAEARISAFVSVRRDKAGVTKKGIVPETEVRERFRRVKPLKEISVEDNLVSRKFRNNQNPGKIMKKLHLFIPALCVAALFQGCDNKCSGTANDASQKNCGWLLSAAVRTISGQSCGWVATAQRGNSVTWIWISAFPPIARRRRSRKF
jgi:hypothetical protein